MNKSFRYLGILLLALAAIHVASCKKKKAKNTLSDDKVYFSINNYMLDAWETNYGCPPFSIVKTERINKGKTDSSFTNSDKIDFAPIVKIFSATDISDPKYLDQYAVSNFPDERDGTYNLYFKTKDDDFLTQKLLITFDPQSMRITGIYIETFEKTVLDETTRKLYYAPMKTIQVQTDAKPLFGKRRLKVEQWDFIR